MSGKSINLEDRFFQGLVLDGDCWLFKPHRSGRYGQLRRDKETGQAKGDHVSAHVYAWEFFRGPIPEGLQIDHLCRVTRCCNPDHLDVVPARINILRSTGPAAVNAVKEFCKRGHSLSGDNLVLVPGGRMCRECRRASWREYQRNRRKNLMAGGQGV